MPPITSFQRRGIVEGFFGPPWSMSDRSALFALGAKRGMNTYLYAPKDDPYHRERWDQPYPEPQWTGLLDLIALAHGHGIDFVYGFHLQRGKIGNHCQHIGRYFNSTFAFSLFVHFFWLLVASRW